MSWSVCTKDMVTLMCTALLIEWGAFVGRRWDRKKWLLEGKYLGIGWERGLDEGHAIGTVFGIRVY